MLLKARSYWRHQVYFIIPTAATFIPVYLFLPVLLNPHADTPSLLVSLLFVGLPSVLAGLCIFRLLTSVQTIDVSSDGAFRLATGRVIPRRDVRQITLALTTGNREYMLLIRHRQFPFRLEVPCLDLSNNIGEIVQLHSYEELLRLLRDYYSGP